MNIKFTDHSRHSHRRRRPRYTVIAAAQIVGDELTLEQASGLARVVSTTHITAAVYAPDATVLIRYFNGKETF